MKRISTLLLSFFLVFAATAAVNPSRLSITSMGRAAISVEIDGNRYERIPGSLVLEDLSSGYHNVKVFEVISERRGFRKSDHYNLIYSSSVLIKPMHHLSISINPAGKVRISEELMRRNRGRGNDRDDWDRNDRGRNNDYYDRDDRGRGYNQPMSDRMFITAKETIRREGFDKDKAMVAKQIVSNNMLYSSQVKELLQLFSFDDYKLDFAKYAYSRTLDRNNFFIIYDSFSFRKSKEELMNYVQNQR